MTERERIWQEYYAAVRDGRKYDQDMYLRQLHSHPSTTNHRQASTGPKPAPRSSGGGCSRCRRRL